MGRVRGRIVVFVVAVAAAVLPLRRASAADAAVTPPAAAAPVAPGPPPPYPPAYPAAGAPAGPAAPVPSAEAAAEAEQNAAIATRRHHRVAWLVVSAVVSGLGIFAVVRYQMLEHQAQDNYTQATTQAQQDAYAKEGRDDSRNSLIGFGIALAGGAGVAISWVSLAMLPHEKKTAVAVAPVIGPGLTGAVATFRF